MNNPFLEALELWLKKGKDPSEIIFRTIDKVIDKFFAILEAKGEINKRTFKDLETYKSDLALKFLERKLLKDKGFDFILTNCENDVHAENTLMFLLKQLNNNLGLEANPDVRDLLTYFESTMTLLESWFIIESSKSKTLYLLREGTQLDDLIAGVEASKKHNKQIRIKIISVVYDELVKNRKMTGADILRRLKDEFNIKDISAYEEEEDDEIFDDEKYRLSCDDKNLKNIWEKEGIDLSITDEVESEIKKKLNKFFKSLEKDELEILVIWLKDKYSEGSETDKKKSFFSSISKIKDLTSLGKSSIYRKLESSKDKFARFLKKLPPDEQITVISFLRPLFVDGAEK